MMQGYIILETGKLLNRSVIQWKPCEPYIWIYLDEDKMFGFGFLKRKKGASFVPVWWNVWRNIRSLGEAQASITHHRPSDYGQKEFNLISPSKAVITQMEQAYNSEDSVNSKIPYLNNYGSWSL